MVCCAPLFTKEPKPGELMSSITCAFSSTNTMILCPSQTLFGKKTFNSFKDVSGL